MRVSSAGGDGNRIVRSRSSSCSRVRGCLGPPGDWSPARRWLLKRSRPPRQYPPRGGAHAPHSRRSASAGTRRRPTSGSGRRRRPFSVQPGRRGGLRLRASKAMPTAPTTLLIAATMAAVVPKKARVGPNRCEPTWAVRRRRCRWAREPTGSSRARRSRMTHRELLSRPESDTLVRPGSSRAASPGMTGSRSRLSAARRWPTARRCSGASGR